MKLGPIPRTDEAIKRRIALSSYRGKKPGDRVNLVMRIAAADPSVLAGAKQRSRTVVLATEEPVMRYDPWYGQELPEILLMSGVQFRRDARQLPLLDSGDASSVRNILGSVRNIRVDRNRLLGEVCWARDAKAQVIAEKWNAGHLDNFAVTNQPLEILEVRRGETYRSIEGPANFVTKWMPLDVGIYAGV